MSKVYDHFMETVETAFEEAVMNIDNFDDDGKIRWDFVDADTYMATAMKCGPFPNDLFYELFDELVEWYCAPEAITA